jgi:hypothetical protein
MTSDTLEEQMTPDEIDCRISFLDDRQVMEINLGDLHLRGSAEVNALYDRIEERIESTGEPLWFFLVNYSGARIDPDAWFAFSRRGKMANEAHSMGSVRFDASVETARQIERSAGTDSFDPNLFASREAALERLTEMPSRRRARIVHTPNYTTEDFAARLAFIPEDQIMDADFSGFTFHHSRDVDDFYDFIEERIKETDRKWYFLVNYNGCQIDPAAWVRYAQRGKRLNIAASLGSVRYATGSETEADIRLRAQSQDFRPNIRNTREEALERIGEMKAEAVH